MKIAVRYYTRTGNTEKLAKTVAAAVGVTAEDVSVPLAEKADVLFLGSAVYAAGVDEAVKTFLAQNAAKIGRIVNFSTAAVLRSTYNQVKKLAEQCGVEMAAEEFYCRGSFAMLHRNRPNNKDLQNAEKFAKMIVDKEKNG